MPCQDAPPTPPPELYTREMVQDADIPKGSSCPARGFGWNRPHDVREDLRPQGSEKLEEHDRLGWLMLHTGTWTTFNMAVLGYVRERELQGKQHGKWHHCQLFLFEFTRLLSSTSCLHDKQQTVPPTTNRCWKRSQCVQKNGLARLPVCIEGDLQMDARVY